LTTCNCSILLQSSAGQAELSWSIVDEWVYTAQSSKPNASVEALTWTDGAQSLWLWPSLLRGQNYSTNLQRDPANELWQFEVDTRSWRRRSLDTYDNNNNSNLYHAKTSNNRNSQYSLNESHRSVNLTTASSTEVASVPLMGWAEGSRSCALSNAGECYEPFSLVRPSCLQMTNAATSARRPGSKSGTKGPKTRPSKRPPRVQLLSTMRPSPTQQDAVAAQPKLSSEPTTSSSTSTSVKSVSSWTDEDTAAEGTTENSVVAVTTEDLADEEVDGDELDLELGSPWHDSESGVFDSIVFCATSAVALCLVSALWCVRHCAPFPKEALLPLRDPPSVRYTAIPDHTLA
ncbi:hypothetical protein BIW11_08833, partial [Tropilaelaps mercedesae]